MADAIAVLNAGSSSLKFSLFAATGVTTGPMLTGVKFSKSIIETETVVMRSVTGTVRRIIAEHRQLDKFHLD